MDDEFFRLMANPTKLKKKKNNLNIEYDELYIILKKKYSNYDWDNKLYKYIKEQIESDLMNYTINDIIDNMINDIINDICIKNK